MRRWEEIEVKPPKRIVVTSIRCDGCGDDAVVIGAKTGFGGTSVIPWGSFEAFTQGSTDPVVLDLCRSCSEDIIKFVTLHKNAIIRRQSDTIKDMED